VNDSSLDSAVRFLAARLPSSPTNVLVLGSGLGAVVEPLEDAVEIPYARIPGFPPTTVQGHHGALLCGRWTGTDVAVLKGRFHLYEGWSPDSVALPLRALAALGARNVVLTNAAGSLRRELVPGSLMLISDHINLMFRNPLIGRVRPGEDRFPDMSDPYDPDLRAAAREAALGLGIPLEEGVYAGVLGPSYETPAEIGMLARLGADAVGMSTVPEVVVARALGLRVLAVSTLTNYAAGLSGERLSHQEVLDVGAAASDRLGRLLRGLLPALTGDPVVETNG
jgi:purine-nucleoside phosphorylase